MSDVKRVLLIGWDAADWKLIGPLMEKGEMPHLQRLIDTGTHGNVATIHPMLSPMLWTSIATGKRPHKHGILGFSEPTPDGASVRPITILSRKTKALWNILHQHGKQSIVVGWWPSHPAEPIRGAMVSNFFREVPEDPAAPSPVPPGSVHPPELATRLADLRVHAMEIDGGMLRMFVPEFNRVDQDKDKGLHALAKILAETMTGHAVATELLASEPWDFAAIYYDAIDHFSHRFMGYHPPQLAWTEDPAFELYRDVLGNAYRYHDAMLGRLLEIAGPETTVVLLSDHGFHSDHLRPRHIPAEAAGPAVEHRHFGVLVLNGPGVRRGERVYGASILDATPTILRLFGIAPGADMDGKVLYTALDALEPLPAVASWDAVPGEDGRHPPDRQLQPYESVEAMKQLVELGYLAPPGEDRARNLVETVEELRYNEARAERDAGRLNRATEVLEQLHRNKPAAGRFAQALVETLLEWQRLDRAQEVLDAFDAAAETQAVKAAEELKQRQGQELKTEDLEAQQPEARREQFERRLLAEQATGYALMRLVLRVRLCLAKAPQDPSAGEQARVLLGEMEQAWGESVPRLAGFFAQSRTALRDYEAAMKWITHCLSDDPADWQALALRARVYYETGRHPEAVSAAVESLSLVYHQPFLQAMLGLSLQAMGLDRQAEEALRVALAQAPGMVAGHEALARLYADRLQDPERARQHQERAASLRKRAQELRTARQTETTTPPPAAPVRSGPQSLPPSHEGAAEWPGVEAQEIVTVVAGLPRTGTSMMMQMLVAGGLVPLTDGKRVADADNPRGYLEYEPATRLRDDASWVPQAKGKVVKIVAQLLPFLPPPLHYRIIFMHRNLQEVIASQQTMLERQGKAKGTLGPAELAAVLDRQAGDVARVMAARPHVRVLHLDYRKVVRQPAEAARRLNVFLGGKLNVDAMVAAVDPALHRQKDRSA